MGAVKLFLVVLALDLSSSSGSSCHNIESQKNNILKKLMKQYLHTDSYAS
jgi:hypothetical protein